MRHLLRHFCHALTITTLMLWAGAPASAQSDPAATPVAAPLAESATNTTLDKNPLGTTRSAGMSEALGAVADDLDALLFNPAGIGGKFHKKNPPALRKLYFPQVSIFANKNSLDLNTEFSSEGGADSSAIGSAIVDANAGKRQYARASSVVGVVIGRFIVVPYNDIQIAAVSQGESTNLVDMRYRSQSGVGFGFSAQDSSERFSLGYSGYIAQRSEIYGAFQYADIIDSAARKSLLKDNTVKSSARAHNLGFTWRMAKTAAPTLSVLVRDLGGTKFVPADSSNDEIVYKQDLTTGFSLGTQPGKPMMFTYMLEADRLADDEVSFEKKLKTSFEWTFAGTGSYARFALRGGYTFAGPSAGFSINLGIIGLEAGLYSVDVGKGNEKLTEHRYTGTLYVNVAEEF